MINIVIMKKSLLLFLNFFPLFLIGQVTTLPVFPIQNQPVIITFDASLGNDGLKDFSGDVYAHTGVITDKSTGSSDWKYVKTTWGTNTPETKLTRLNTNTYQLTIIPDIRSYYTVPAADKILKLAFVFRSADATKQGKTASGGDIFCDVFDDSLNISISKPTSAITIFDADQDFAFQADASNNDSITLFLDNARIVSVASHTLTTTIHATGPTNHFIIVRAYKGITYVADTIYYIVRGAVQTQPVQSGMRDGINYSDDQTATLVIYAPYKTYIYAIGDFNNWLPDNAFLMKKDGDRFWITLTNLTPGREYIFQYLIDGSLRIADPYTEKTSDPNDHYIQASIYPGMLAYPSSKTTEIASVLQTAQLPFAWKTNDFTPAPKSTLVIYELLIRDFTAKHDIRTLTDTIPYLKRLGVNVIELMPFSEFEGNDSWGYNPSFYFAPDKAYGTKDDYKTFVDACHQNGIAVVQDLVLNHSFGQSPLVRMYFDNGKPTAQNPWYNQVSNMQNPDAQWGNDFNHESIHTKNLIDSIASFWMHEYRIDGFRYDFTKGFTNTPYGPTSWASDYDPLRISILERMASAVWKRNANAYIIFEHLSDNSEETVLANYGILLWGNLNYNFNEATMGYNENGKSDFSWMSYKKRGWNTPNIVAYMESHDEERLMFKNLAYGNASGSYNVKELQTSLQRMQMASAFFYAVPGPKMLWEFGELGYDVRIDSGGRTGQKPIHWDYYNDWRRKSLYDVTHMMITLKEHDPVFSTDKFSLDVSGPMKHIELSGTEEQVEVIGNFDVIAHTGEITFPSAGKWYELFGGDSIDLGTNTYSYNFEPGVYKLFCNRKLEGFGTLHTKDPDKTKNTDTLVFPNPFDDIIYLPVSEKIKSISVWNSIGQLVLKNDGNIAKSLDTKSLTPGFYILTLYFIDGNTKAVKVVKSLKRL